MDRTKNTLTVLLGTAIPIVAFAKGGSVDYSWGADALATMHDYVITLALYVQKVLNKAECWRTKSKRICDKNNCFSMIYEQNKNYNLS